MKLPNKSTMAMTACVLIVFVFVWLKTSETAQQNQSSAVRFWIEYHNDAQEWNKASDDPYLIFMRESRTAERLRRTLRDKNAESSETISVTEARDLALNKANEIVKGTRFRYFDLKGSPTRNKQDWLDYSLLYDMGHAPLHENLIYASQDIYGKTLLSLVAKQLRKSQVYQWLSYAAILGVLVSPFIAVMLCRILSQCIDAAYREHMRRLKKNN